VLRYRAEKNQRNFNWSRAALALISGFGLLVHGIIWGGIDVVICAVATVMAIQTRPSRPAEKAPGEVNHRKP
jgi:hypothetical protein